MLSRKQNQWNFFHVCTDYSEMWIIRLVRVKYNSVNQIETKKREELQLLKQRN